MEKPTVPTMLLKKGELLDVYGGHINTTWPQSGGLDYLEKSPDGCLVSLCSRLANLIDLISPLVSAFYGQCLFKVFLGGSLTFKA